MIKPRNLMMAAVIAVFSGWIGFWLGERRLQVAWANWKPDVVISREVPVGLGKPDEVDFSMFWTVWDKVNQLYVDKSALDGKKMVDGAIAGMVASIGDPYTAYLTSEQNKESKDELGGSFEGVGIQLGFKDKRLSVVAPLEGTPAKQAGVRAGDFIIRIQDEAKGVDQITDGISLPEAVKLIRGQKGTKVLLTLVREGVEEPFEVSLMRDTIVVKSVTLEWIDRKQEPRVAWLKLSRFGDRTQEEWQQAVEEISVNCLQAGPGSPKKCDGVVLDVRNNPGGYLEGAVYLAGEFLPVGKAVVSQQYGDGRKVDSKVARNGRLVAMPVVVVVNEGSASAAEILAGALQDVRRIKVVGEKSFGKGSVQQPEDFADGSGVHVTVAKWLRPSGDWLDQKGVSPDYVVEWDNGDTGGDWTKDPQLVKAVEVL